MRNCIHSVLVNANNQSHLRNPKDNKTNLDKGTSPYYNRTSECSTGCAERAELREGGSLAQVTVHRQILKENEIEVYEKNTKSNIGTLVKNQVVPVHTTRVQGEMMQSSMQS